MTLAEQWRPVAGFPYEVSDLGRVRNARNGRVLRPGRCKSGHYTVALGGRSQYVHRLVAAAFLGVCPAGLEVRHRDDDGANNAIENLVYGTRSQNNRDKKWNKGQSNFRLAPKQVAEIKRRQQTGARGIDLAADFGVAATTISAIKHGKFHIDV